MSMHNCIISRVNGLTWSKLFLKECQSMSILLNRLCCTHFVGLWSSMENFITIYIWPFNFDLFRTFHSTDIIFIEHISEENTAFGLSKYLFSYIIEMDLSDSSLHVSKIDSHEHQVDPVHQEESNVRGCNVLRLSLCTGHANGCDLRIKLCIGIFIVILVMIMVVIVTYRLSTRYGPKETSTLSQMVSGCNVITAFVTKRVPRFLEGFVLFDL
jgi:hypothetical protein